MLSPEFIFADAFDAAFSLRRAYFADALIISPL